jgi:hypothetical protein
VENIDRSGWRGFRADLETDPNPFVAVNVGRSVRTIFNKPYWIVAVCEAGFRVAKSPGASLNPDPGFRLRDVFSHGSCPVAPAFQRCGVAFAPAHRVSPAVGAAGAPLSTIAKLSRSEK